MYLHVIYILDLELKKYYVKILPTTGSSSEYNRQLSDLYGISALTAEELNFVKLAIKYHNKLSIPENVTEETPEIVTISKGDFVDSYDLTDDEFRIIKKCIISLIYYLY